MLIKISAGLLKLFLLAILIKPLRILIIIFNKLEISWSPFWTSIHFIKIKSKSATAPTALPVLSPSKHQEQQHHQASQCRGVVSHPLQREQPAWVLVPILQAQVGAVL